MDIIPDDCLSTILAFWAADYAPATREVCRRWRGLAPRRELAPPMCGRRFKAATLRELIAAGRGDLLVWVLVERRDRRPVPVGLANRILSDAAQGGHKGLCLLAKEWGAFSFDQMLHHAASGGHGELCCLARAWGATDFDRMMSGAALSGHGMLCGLAKHWGATKFDVMLRSAALGGCGPLCRVAKGWGATDFDGMLLAARKYGHDDLCALANAWTAEAERLWGTDESADKSADESADD